MTHAPAPATVRHRTDNSLMIRHDKGDGPNQRRRKMDASEIKPGIRVAKGMFAYTVVSIPVEDVFKATDDKGETLVLYVGEVERFMIDEDQ
jgi:hypothetical protein